MNGFVISGNAEDFYVDMELDVSNFVHLYNPTQCRVVEIRGNSIILEVIEPKEYPERRIKE